MKIAIHHRPGSFSERWIDYCNQRKIKYKIVNCYDSNIIDQVRNCDVLLWHHNNYDYRDALFAKQLLFSLQAIGIKTYPDYNTNWHFDDKVAQKYLLESIQAPVVPSFVFYSKKDAYKWTEETKFPVVFKLRGGSGSSNVQLIKNKAQAKKIIRKAFAKGFAQFDRWNHLKLRWGNYRSGQEKFIGVLKGMARLIIGTDYSRNAPREKGYVYFQTFMPNNDHDTRVVVVNGKAAAEKRKVRRGDFRASGSGIFEYEDIDIRTIKIAQEVARKLKLQSVAFDFIKDETNNPRIVEMSYGFGIEGIEKAPGYWNENLEWHKKNFYPTDLIIERLLDEI